MRGAQLVTALAILLVWSMGIDRAAATETLRVGIPRVDAYPHYGFRDGAAIGFAARLFSRFAADQGMDVAFVSHPVDRLYDAAISGEIDLIYPDTPNWRRALKQDVPMSYSAPVAEYVEGVMVLPEHYGRPLHELKHLGRLQGCSVLPFETTVGSGFVSIASSRTTVGLLRRAMGGYVDGVYMNVDVAAHILADGLVSPGGLVFDPNLPHTRSHYRAASVKHPDLIRTLDRWMADRFIQINRLAADHGVNHPAARPRVQTQTARAGDGAGG